MSASNGSSSQQQATRKRKAEDMGESEKMNDFRKLLSPLSKEQIIEILSVGAMMHDDVLKYAESVVASSPASRRLMVRNISFNTTTEQLLALFRQFGEIEEGTIVKEKDGRSKGFGFLTFKNLDSVKQATSAELTLDGRQLAIKLAADPYSETVSSAAFQGATDPARRKLFIRNLADTTTVETLRQVFEPYGVIEDCIVVSDQAGRTKGFGFVTYCRVEDATKASQQPQRIIDGRMVFISFASVPKRDYSDHHHDKRPPHIPPMPSGMPPYYQNPGFYQQAGATFGGPYGMPQGAVMPQASAMTQGMPPPASPYAQTAPYQTPQQQMQATAYQPQASQGGFHPQNPAAAFTPQTAAVMYPTMSYQQQPYQQQPAPQAQQFPQAVNTQQPQPYQTAPPQQQQQQPYSTS